MFYQTSIKFILKTFPVALVWLSLFTFPAWSQLPDDSASVSRDSIQDARVDRMEWETGRRMNRLQDLQDEQGVALDSAEAGLDFMEERMDQLGQDLERLDGEKKMQAEELSSIAEALEQTRATSQRYQQRLKRTLWVSVVVILLLLLASFTILLLYSLKTRQLLDRFKIKILDELRRQKKSQRAEMKACKKRQRAEMKAHKKESGKTMLKVIQKLKKS